MFAFGCALYWGEGNKDYSQVGFTNTDADMLRLFVKFVQTHFGCPPENFRVRVTAYLNNGLSVEDINSFWISTLGLPPSCIRSFSLRSRYYPENGSKKNKHPYGVCQVRVAKSFEAGGMLLGAIQELAGINKPEWVVPRKRD
jgi:hypothetical protein